MTTAPPCPWATSWRSAARVQRNVPFSVTSSTLDHCSSVMSSTEAVPPRPALLIITSIRPKCPAAPSISAVTCTSSVTSQGWDQNPVTVRPGQVVAGRGQPLVVLVADHHPGAFFQAAPRGGAADAGAGGGGDHHHLAVQQAVPVHQRGRPSARVAMMSCWISSDPP